jgi:hypothetical protein
MVTHDDIEAFLDRLQPTGATYSEVSDGLWQVRPGGDLAFGVVVHRSPPVVVIRVKVMDLPKDAGKQAALNRRLLELNASDLLHGSYGIEADAVVITEALELDHLDYEEFRAAYESITVSLASHIRELASFREAR